MTLKTFTLALIISGVIFPQTSSAKVYKCKSADGKTSFQSTPCAKGDTSVKNRIGGSREGTVVANSDTSSIYGTWVDVKDSSGKMVISSSGKVTFNMPGQPRLIGTLSKKAENKYHVKASLEDFDLSSDLSLNPETGDLLLRMGPQVKSTFRKQ